MPKFGKLELTDDSDDDTEDVRVVSNRKRAVETIIISSDEEDDNSSDLSSLPSSPAPLRCPVLKGDNNGSRERKTAERTQATGSLFGSTSGRTLGGTSSGDDDDVTILETTPRKPSIRGTQDSAFQADQTEEDCDDDSIYETPIPAQDRTVQAGVTNTKQMPHNELSENPSRQSSTILAGTAKPSKQAVHNPPASSPPRTQVPYPTVSLPTTKPSQMPLNKQAPRRSLKNTKLSSDIMSWNPSERIQPTQSRPLKPQNPVSTSHNDRSSVTAAPLAPSNPFPFANKALLVRLKRPPAPPRPSLRKSSPIAAVPVAAPAAPPKGAAIETEEEFAGPRLTPKCQPDIKRGSRATSDTPNGSLENNADVITRAPRLAFDGPMPDQNTYILTSEYDRQLYQAVGSHWAPLARMREQLANARLTEDMDGDSDVVSASEGDAEHPLDDPWYRGIGRERVCSCRPGEGQCNQPGNCVARRGEWRSGLLEGVGMGRLDHDHNTATQAHIPGVIPPVQERTHSIEENVSVAMAMRRYAERLWSAASSVPKIWTGTVSSGEAVELQEEGDILLPQAEGVVTEGDGDIPMPNPESHVLAKDDREGSYELPSPSTNAIKLPASQATTLPLAHNESTTPIATPTTVVSTAPTLVNASTTLKKPVTLSPVKSVSVTSPKPCQVRTTIEPPTTNNIGQSQQSPYPYDFSYESSAMHISSAPWDANSFAMIRTTVSNSKATVPPETSATVEPPDPAMKTYRPTRYFLGVVPPRIPGMRGYATHAARGNNNRRELAKADDSFTEVEDLSESDLGPDALRLYLERMYAQEMEQDLKPAKETRKRKAVDSDSSASEGTPEYGEYAAVKKKAKRGSRKRRKYSQTPSRAGSSSHPRGSAVPTVRAARRLGAYSAGMSVTVPFGLNVDDIDTSSIEIREVRENKVNTTSLCHNCRCSNTSAFRKAQCGNITIRHTYPSNSDGSVQVRSSSRCSKTFCERCLRGWYGLDDDAIEFVKGGQRVIEGKCTGTGVGLGIVEGIWICPFCISLCMCTVCSRKRGVERTRYAPSANAVISAAEGGLIEPTVRTGGTETRRNARPKPLASESGSQPPSSTPIPPIRLVTRRPAAPPVPMQWLPAIPTPTPGLDPIYYEATRPCTRDFPTGAPQPTAANHAPVVYQPGAALEKDGLEDSFTGSEASESDADGEERVGGQSARSRSKSSSSDKRAITTSNMVAPATRKNFLIVVPGRRMPSTMKKKRELIEEPLSSSSPTPTPELMTLAIPDLSEHALDGIASVSLKSPMTAVPDDASPIFDGYPTTVDPADLSGPLDDNFTPYFGECEVAETGSPDLAMIDYHDFVPIPDADMSVPEGFTFPLDNDGDTFMEDGDLSLFLGHSSPHQDPGAPSPHYDLLTYIDDPVGESLTDPYVPDTTFADEGDTFVFSGTSASASLGVEEFIDHSA